MTSHDLNFNKPSRDGYFQSAYKVESTADGAEGHVVTYAPDSAAPCVNCEKPKEQHVRSKFLSLRCPTP